MDGGRANNKCMRSLLIIKHIYNIINAHFLLIILILAIRATILEIGLVNILLMINNEKVRFLSNDKRIMFRHIGCLQVEAFSNFTLKQGKTYYLIIDWKVKLFFDFVVIGSIQKSEFSILFNGNFLLVEY